MNKEKQQLIKIHLSTKKLLDKERKKYKKRLGFEPSYNELILIAFNKMKGGLK